MTPLVGTTTALNGPEPLDDHDTRAGVIIVNGWLLEVLSPLNVNVAVGGKDGGKLEGAPDGWALASALGDGAAPLADAAASLADAAGALVGASVGDGVGVALLEQAATARLRTTMDMIERRRRIGPTSRSRHDSSRGRGPASCDSPGC
ncbi:MAG: hypothetical protein ACHQ3P_01205 [Candidatus Limnocylindrales bacterium]